MCGRIPNAKRHNQLRTPNGIGCNTGSASSQQLLSCVCGDVHAPYAAAVAVIGGPLAIAPWPSHWFRSNRRRARMHGRYLGCRQRTRRGRGTVARASSRLAACAGVAAAALLIGAPCAAVAVADGGGSGSHSNHGGGGNGDGNGGNAGGGNTSDTKPKVGNNRPRTTVGSGRNDVAGGDTSDDQPGQRSGPRQSTWVDRSGSSGGTAAGTPDLAPAPPTVRFGDGRSPHYLPPVGAPHHSSAPTVAPAPAPPPTVIATRPTPSVVDRLLSSSALLSQGGTHSGLLPDPLLGLAGLLVFPAAGGVLGYRQAKAAQAAREGRR
jgi:hypothetical protein